MKGKCNEPFETYLIRSVTIQVDVFNTVPEPPSDTYVEVQMKDIVSWRHEIQLMHEEISGIMYCSKSN